MAVQRNPSRSGDGLNFPVTYSYDALGRVTGTTRQDGSAAAVNYLGPVVTATDEAGKVKRSRYDALGRLVQVTDDPGGANLSATYSYDANDQLSGVDQGGQHRDFIYDALRRLRTVQNPESGTTLYAYDAGGNLRTKFDQRGITTTYTYDALDRLTAKSSSDGSVNVAYGYDAPSVPYSAGRLTSVGNGAAARYTTAYDAQGRITAAAKSRQGRRTRLATATMPPVR